MTFSNVDLEKREKSSDIEISDGKDEKTYSYSDALDLAGDGVYNIGLTIILSVTLWAMCVDLFSFSVVVSFSSCEFDLDIGQKSFLVSIPFIGPVIMSYAWGYICDTQGRRKSLLIAMTVSFVMSTLCAFAPNWIVLAILKLIGTCCCSCAQSATSTLLGESCPERVKNTYMFVMSSVVHLGSTTYFTLSYFIGRMDFVYDLGLITFVPWRFLVLVLALPLGLGALGLLFFYESPKFLLNADREDEAIEVLKLIYKRNGGKLEDYPVKKLVLNEQGNLTRKNVPLLQSMWEQTAPLFQRPYLCQTLLLFYILFVMYSSNNGLYMWLPFLAKAFTANASTFSDGNQAEGLCNTLPLMANATSNQKVAACSPQIEFPLMMAAVIYGCSVSILNGLVAKLASRKRSVLMGICIFSCICCLGTVAIPSNKSNFLYFGILVTSMCGGPIAIYYVELFPTSFRGMAACLGVMVSRISSIIGINVMGPIIMTNCSATFYGVFVLTLSGILAAFWLPPDRPKKGK